MLRQALEIFQLEVGLSTDIFAKSVDRLGHLAWNGWWKHLWLVAALFEVRRKAAFEP